MFLPVLKGKQFSFLTPTVFFICDNWISVSTVYGDKQRAKPTQNVLKCAFLRFSHYNKYK